MIKKYVSYLGVLVLACFSFYYTDRAVDIVKRNDPIMKDILTNSNNYYVSPVSAIVDGDEIIPGINGKEVNVNKSYQNMKKYNNYNEAMYIFKEITPNVSFVSEYDKYIVRGNSIKNQIALLFKVNDYSYLDSLNNILLEKNTDATFFIDGSIIENHVEDIVGFVNKGYEIENLGYDGDYSIERFGWTIR